MLGFTFCYSPRGIAVTLGGSSTIEILWGRGCHTHSIFLCVEDLNTLPRAGTLFTESSPWALQGLVFFFPLLYLLMAEVKCLGGNEWRRLLQA